MWNKSKNLHNYCYCLTRNTLLRQWWKYCIVGSFRIFWQFLCHLTNTFVICDATPLAVILERYCSRRANWLRNLILRRRRERRATKQSSEVLVLWRNMHLWRGFNMDAREKCGIFSN